MIFLSSETFFFFFFKIYLLNFCVFWNKVFTNSKQEFLINVRTFTRFQFWAQRVGERNPKWSQLGTYGLWSVRQEALDSWQHVNLAGACRISSSSMGTAQWLANNLPGHICESPKETRSLVSYGDSNVWPGRLLQASVGYWPPYMHHTDVSSLSYLGTSPRGGKAWLDQCCPKSKILGRPMDHPRWITGWSLLHIGCPYMMWSEMSMKRRHHNVLFIFNQ